jgi:hypothetical protein
MADSTTPAYRFDTLAGLALAAAFDGGRLRSDGGLVWLAEADRALGLCAALAACVPEWRRGGVRHGLEALVRQRVFRIACGYEDQDDADSLRADPLLKLVCGRAPETGADPASQPTLSRLENAVDRRAVEALAEALVATYVRERGAGGPPARVRLDLDGTDDPAHGQQEGVCYHGYYRQHLYHPLLVLDADTGHLIAVVLRPGNAHGSRFAALVLRRLVRRLRAAWPGVAVEVRADSGFAVPRLYARCEANDVAYEIDLIPNPALERRAAPLLTEARWQSEGEGGAKVRPAGEAAYRAGTWDRPRRVVFKAEILEKGPNTRFVATSRADPPLATYDRYVGRGASENAVKDLKNALAGDRLSDHRSWANAFRLVLHAAAYWLLDTLRRRLAGTRAAAPQLDTLRPQLLKVAGRVRQLAQRVRLHLAESHPSQPLWDHLKRLSPAPVNNPGYVGVCKFLQGLRREAFSNHALCARGSVRELTSSYIAPIPKR